MGAQKPYYDLFESIDLLKEIPKEVGDALSRYHEKRLKLINEQLYQKSILEAERKEVAGPGSKNIKSLP